MSKFVGYRLHEQRENFLFIFHFWCINTFAIYVTM